MLVGHTCDKLVGEAHPLRGAKRVAIAVSIVLVKSLVVVVLVPLLLGEESAEWRDGAVWGSYSVERAQVHHVDDFCSGEVRSCEVAVEALLDGRDENAGPCLLCTVRDFAVRAVFESRAKIVVQSVVLTSLFRNHQNWVWVRRIEAEMESVGLSCIMEALSEVLSRLDNAVLARRSNEGSQNTSQLLIALVELDARVDHFLLTERAELVRSQSVLVVLKERILSRVALHVLVDLLNCGIVRSGLGSCRVTGTMARQDLSKCDCALRWHGI